MARRRVVVNTNPNKTPAPGMRNATLHYSELDAMNDAYEEERAKDAGKKYEKPKPKTIKVDSNPVKPGKTVIGPLARGGFSGRGGGMLGPKANR